MKFCSWHSYTEILASSLSAGQHMINIKSIINIAIFNHNGVGKFLFLKEKSVFFLRITQNELF